MFACCIFIFELISIWISQFGTFLTTLTFSTHITLSQALQLSTTTLTLLGELVAVLTPVLHHTTASKLKLLLASRVSGMLDVGWFVTGFQLCPVRLSSTQP